MAIKDRKVYGLVNFRGLDKENKPLKVSPFRAVDGENFIIDSETLKTRPAFKYKKTPLKNEENVIIDFYDFRGLMVYITKKGFRFKYNDKLLNLSTSIPTIKTTLPNEINFIDVEPIFQEEKDCLFIFGLNDIFVVSILKEENGDYKYVVLYKLNEKPRSLFEIDDPFFNEYKDLPEPYEPTLFIGDKNFDDVNLLSNVSKYQLFSKTSKGSQGGINLYTLPTHYDPKKHGNNPEIEVKFYDERFQDIKVFPMFLGKNGENYTYIEAEHGLYINTEPTKIEKFYKPKESFEYNYMQDGTHTPIKEVLGITKEEFFNLKIEGSYETVFEFLLTYVSKNNIESNKRYKFELPYDVSCVYYNSSGSIVMSKIEQKTAIIDVLLKVAGFAYFEIHNKETYDISTVLQKPSSGYPLNMEFPNPKPSGEFDYQVKLFHTPSKKNTYDEIYLDFESKSENWIANNRKITEMNTQNNKIRLTGNYYTEYYEPERREFYGFENYINFLGGTRPIGKSFDGSVNPSDNFDYFDDESETSEYTKDLPNQLHNSLNQFIDITIDKDERTNFLEQFPQEENWNTFEEFINDSYYWRENVAEFIETFFDFNTIVYEIEDYFSENNLLNDLNVAEYGNWLDCRYIFTIRLRVKNENETGFLEHVHFRMVVGFEYIVYKKIEYRTLYTMSKTFQVVESTPVIIDLYSTVYDEEQKAFLFKCGDYFYDFNGKPSINIKITFEKNPDYQKIANSKFGITFGSENRLFLAGNKDYPNIDRFNVSNDLLGNNVKNQSYELSYFPSKNYRVLGGKGAINGYVVATDTQLYITKEDYPNDQKLFIRNRTMDDNGIVGYNEFKTNIERTPLNNRTLVRFYNDILVLDKNGLFGLEIGGNVLTNERMVKMRSGFINKDLKDNVSKVGKDKVFIYEDNHYMYMFVGKKVYVADSRYVDQNPNAEPGNFNYEIVVWDIPVEFKTIKRINGELELLDKDGKHIYVMRDDNTDDIVDRKSSYLSKSDDINQTSSFLGQELERFEDKEKIAFVFDNDKVFKLLATGDDATFETDNQTSVCVITNDFAFRGVVDGDTLYLKRIEENTFLPITVNNFEASGRESFTFEEVSFDENEYEKRLYIDVSKQRLYPLVYYKDDDKTKVILSPFYQVPVVVESVGEALDLSSGYHNQYLFENNDGMMKDVLIIEEEKIKLRWVSAILDFGNNIFEKTTFRANVYATKLKKENTITVGYRTMRKEDYFMEDIDIANQNNLEALNFNRFGFNTFSEMGASFPLKENNFLYIQFEIVGTGQIELNSIEIIYKLNRLLKSIG